VRKVAAGFSFALATCRPEPPPAATPPPVVAAAPAAPAAEPRSPEDPVVLVTDPAVLTALPELSFGRVVLGSDASTTAQLATDPAFASIVDVLRADLESDARADPRAGVGMKHAHRQFDPRWLDDPRVRLSLVGIANRLDRRPFAPEHCGETRLIYRLAYATHLEEQDVASRLPMTVNVVFWQEGAECSAVARRWLVETGTMGAALAARLRGPTGPLANAHLAAPRLKSVEVDVQTVRWPSAVHPGLGGHAEYTLRVFQRRGERFEPAPLENTPDVGRLRADPALRRELLAWLSAPERAQALDDGTFVVPDRFLARRSVSVTPRGFSRLANRPFSALFSAHDLRGVDFGRLPHFTTPVALLRRLDGSSCAGCHESRSVAGFHLLGEDPPDAQLDALAVGISPHLQGELPRRAAFVQALADGQSGDPFRPLAEHAPGDWGAHCAMTDPGLASFRCADDLECVALDDPEMGICLPAQAGGAGEPCQVGHMRTTLDPQRDRVADVHARTCAAGSVCNGNAVGFPQGMCTPTCAAIEARTDAACGAIVALEPFNHCVARGRPFPACVAQNAHPAGMRACDAMHPCRDDYVCARSPNAAAGVCLPPYFLFQLRVDGHVLGPP
jgi:hypothetical protein